MSCSEDEPSPITPDHIEELFEPRNRQPTPDIDAASSHPLNIHRRMEMQNQGSLLKIGGFQEKETMVELDGTPVILLSVADYNTPARNQQVSAMLQDRRQYCASCADGDST